jgi:hypothetical protein
LVVPGAAILQTIYSGLKWLADNADQIADFLQKLFSGLDTLLSATGVAAAGQTVFNLVKGLAKDAIDLIVKLVLSFLHIDFNKVLDRVKCILNYAKNKVKQLLWKVLAKVVPGLANKPVQKPYCKLRTKCQQPSEPGNCDPPKTGKCDQQQGGCFVAGTLVHAAPAPIAIELVKLLERVHTYGSDEAAHRPLEQTGVIDPATCRLVRLTLQRYRGSSLEAVLVRSEEWIAALRAQPGATIWLDLEHVGIRGEAKVTAIDPCPPIPKEEGRLVTGTFRHSRAWVYDLTLEGEERPIGVTGRHPFWSVDSSDWVPVSDLRIGERLRGLNGTPRVESLTLREEPEPIYNIEVNGDHVYRVGEQGLLVHNQSGPAAGCCSGLSNTGDLTPVTNVSVGGRNVPIYGTGQATAAAGTCPNGVNRHAQASLNIARMAAATGDYEYLTLNRAWSTSTGATSDARRPDVIGVRCDGRVYAWEVISVTDDPAVLRARVNAGMATLPLANQGMTFVVPATC